jgi:shikimate kinase/3-dehydroquinate synthase
MSELSGDKRAIVLIGPPGAGKTTVGGLLARDLKVAFADSDRLIEDALGKKIADIFVEDGEPFFREYESRIVVDLLDDPKGVIALGGGAIMSHAVQDSLADCRDRGVDVIFLDVSIGHAAPRVGFNKERPLLMVNPRASWQELMNKRRPIYERICNRTIDTNGCTPEEVVAKITASVSDAI